MNRSRWPLGIALPALIALGVSAAPMAPGLVPARADHGLLTAAPVRRWTLQPVMSRAPHGCADPADSRAPDIRRHLSEIRASRLCYQRELVEEGRFRWVFHVFYSLDRPDGPFWVLPHDNESSAFGAALYAVRTYGGGFLAVDSGGGRRFQGQDPNRNFSKTPSEAARCSAQRVPAPRFTDAVLRHYAPNGRLPFLSLHNNADGWEGNGGQGTISVQRNDGAYTGFRSSSARGELRDEDNLVFIAGSTPIGANRRARAQVAALGQLGLNVVYKQVTDASFNCSMSDYIVEHRLGDYYNIETQHGHEGVQEDMIDRLMRYLGHGRDDRAPPGENLFLTGWPAWRLVAAMASRG